MDSSPATQNQAIEPTDSTCSINEARNDSTPALLGVNISNGLGKSFKDTLLGIDQEIKKFDSKTCTYQGVKVAEARATEVDSNLDSTTLNPTPPIQPSDLSGHVQ